MCVPARSEGLDRGHVYMHRGACAYLHAEEWRDRRRGPVPPPQPLPSPCHDSFCPRGGQQGALPAAAIGAAPVALEAASPLRRAHLLSLRSLQALMSASLAAVSSMAGDDVDVMTPSAMSSTAMPLEVCRRPPIRRRPLSLQAATQRVVCLSSSGPAVSSPSRRGRL